MDLMLLLLTVDSVAPLKDIFALCISGALRVVCSSPTARASSDFTFTTTGDRVLILLYCGWVSVVVGHVRKRALFIALVVSRIYRLDHSRPWINKIQQRDIDSSHTLQAIHNNNNINLFNSIRPRNAFRTPFHVTSDQDPCRRWWLDIQSNRANPFSGTYLTCIPISVLCPGEETRRRRCRSCTTDTGTAEWMDWLLHNYLSCCHSRATSDQSTHCTYSTLLYSGSKYI